MFCLINQEELGKIISIGEKECIIEFFDSPAVEPRKVLVPRDLIRSKRLEYNTRVFVFDEALNQWRIGRVREDDGQSVEVRLANKTDVDLNYEQIFVRSKRPIEDPVDFLKNLLTEPPQYAEARSGFLRNYIFQRGEAFGISALLSSAIDLEAHQIDVVRRILTDHTQRYLLADEVGLGKTIEAGVIIRQTVLDDLRGHRILVLVPYQLVNQWREELATRFGLSDFLDKSVLVLPQENNQKLKNALQNLSLLVIDEVHHLTAPNAIKSLHNVYELVKETTSQVERLLLLSATPVLRNEGGFLRMLNLLDPTIYPLDDLEGFRTKISNRQTLAESVAALEPSNIFLMDSYLDDLLNRLPNDQHLAELEAVVRKESLKLDEFDPDFCSAVRQLKAHISETYKLNRRILRNRRTQVEGLTPDRNGAQVWPVEIFSMTQVELALEEWRVRASLAIPSLTASEAAKLAKFYWDAVNLLFECPFDFLQACTERLKDIDSEDLMPFDDERNLLDSIIQAIDVDSWMSERLEKLYELVAKLLQNSTGTKVVIFCANESTARLIFQHLQEMGVKLVQHDPESEWQSFLTDPKVRSIVCDRRAEEGVNLQGRERTVIHFDLPFQPNRIEQRMGRVDRYGAGGKVSSYALVDEDAPLQKAWFRILDEGLGVFDRSISSLQYLVEERLTFLKDSLVHDGAEGLDALCERLGGASGEVVQELKHIHNQDELDQLTPMLEQELDDLFDVDEDWQEINETMSDWIATTLLFDKVDLPNFKKNPSGDAPFRFHYRETGSKLGPPTLIPLSDFRHEFLGAIDFEAGGRYGAPRSYPYVCHRATAVNHGIRPLRYGTEFIEAIRSFSEVDDRGRSYAMWRQVFDQFQPMEIRMCFRFDFLIETDLKEAFAVLTQSGFTSSDLARSSLARRGDSLFHPTVFQVWLDEEGDELPQEFIERYLALPYAKKGGENYIDHNLDVHFPAFKNWSPDTFTNWDLRCERMRDKAKSITKSKQEIIDRQNHSLQKALAEDEIRYAQLQTRIQTLEGREAKAEANQLELEKAINKALHQGISFPSIKVDVAGVIFLTNEPIYRILGVE